MILSYLVVIYIFAILVKWPFLPKYTSLGPTNNSSMRKLGMPFNPPTGLLITI